MSKKKKRNTIPSLPGKLKDPPVEKDRTTRRDWENVARGVVKRYRKVEKKSSNYGILARAELKGAMEQRRMEAMSLTKRRLTQSFRILCRRTPLSSEVIHPGKRQLDPS